MHICFVYVSKLYGVLFNLQSGSCFFCVLLGVFVKRRNIAVNESRLDNPVIDIMTNNPLNILCKTNPHKSELAVIE